MGMFNKNDKEVKTVVNGTDNMPEPRSMTNGQVKEFRALGLDPQLNRNLLSKQARLMHLREHLQPQENETVKSIKEEELEDIIGLGSDYIIEAQEITDKAHWWILENVYKECDFDNADYKACEALTKETYRITFGKVEDVKNS
jgi:hypothetical protein